MTIETIETKGIKHRIKFTIKADEIHQATEKELSNIIKNGKFPGFRPGKIPRSFVEKKYFDGLWSDSCSKIMQDKVDEVITKKGFDIANRPVIDKIDHEIRKDCVFEVSFEIMPKIDIPDFKKITIEKPKVEVAEADIDAEISKIKKETKLHVKSKRSAAKEGDMVVLSYSYMDQGKLQEVKDQKFIIGDSQISKKLGDILIGKKPKDEFKVNTNILMGDSDENPAQIDAQVQKVLELATPTKIEHLADNFAEGDVEKFKENLKNRLQERYDHKIYMLAREDFFKQLGDILDFEIPSNMIEEERKILEDMIKGVKEDDSTDEDKEKDDKAKSSKKAPSKKKEQDHKKFIEELSTKRLRSAMVIAEYAKLKEIDVTREEINMELMKKAPLFEYDFNKLSNFFNKYPAEAMKVRNGIIEDKAIRQIFENEVVMQTKEYSLKKLDQLIEKKDKENIKLFGF